MKLLIAIPLTAADLPMTQLLVSSLSSLGPYLEHPVLFVADHNLHKDQYTPILTLAKPLFGQGELITTPISLPDETFPRGHNFRFETAARHIGTHRNLPFLWLLPRCVPMRRGWLRELEEEYFARRKPFMGHVLTPEVNGTSKPFMASAGIYPATLPKRIFQRLIAQRQTDWEQSCAELIVPNTHPTQLICCVPGNPETPPDFAKLPRAAALVHTTAARRLTAMLRGEPIAPIEIEAAIAAKPAPEPVIQPEQTPTRLPEKVSTVPPLRAGYYHSGDLGDIVYALYAIMKAGGGKLYLGPRQKGTPSAANPIREDRFKLIEPLISVQPYITQCTYKGDRYPGTDLAFDLNRFRLQWVTMRPKMKTLIRMHCYTLGVDELLREDEPWLTVPNPIPTGMFICHRSTRYRNEEFPWQTVVDYFGKNLLFVGLPSEHAEFSKTYGKVAFWQCTDFLELARVIAGSNGFIGNQSFPNAIALGLGQRVLQEHWGVSGDCIFARPNFLTQPFTKGQIESWTKSKLAASPPIPKSVAKDTPSPNLGITAPAENFTGFGQLTNALADGLAKRRHKFSVAPWAGETTTAPLSNALQENLVKRAANRDLLICPISEITQRLVKGEVLLTMWEASRLTRDIVNAINLRAACVIVPTQWNASCFSASGVNVPIRIVQLGVDPSVYRYAPMPASPPFRFGTAGRLASAGKRKGIEETIEWFQAAFPTEMDVALHVKIFADCKLELPKSDPRIIVDRRFIPEPEFVQWYRNLHCFVSMTKGEGWGLHIHQAMATGRPVIVPRQGGQSEFVTTANAYCCDFTLSVPDWGCYVDGGHWCIPDRDSCISLMRHVYRHTGEASAVGQTASDSVSKFTWEKMVDGIVTVLKEFKKL